jgi:hypothetical protein
MVAALVLAALAATLYWSNHRKPTDDTSKADASTTTKVIALTQDDINALDIKKKGGDDVVLNRVGPSNWKITAPKPLLADQDPVSTMLYSLSPMDGATVIDDKPSDLKAYGLADPAVKVSTTEKDGKTQTVLFGDDTPTGDSAYVMLSGDPRVYAVSASTKKNFDKGVKDLRDKRLVPVNFDKITSVALAGSKANLTFGSDNGKWTVQNPKDLRADPSMLETIVSELKTANMDPTTSDDDAKKAAAAFASGTPVATVKATDAAGSSEIQVRKNKDAYYAKSSAMDGVYKVSTSLGDAISKNLEDFRKKTVFDFASEVPEKIEMHDGEKTYSMTRTGDDWYSNGKKMDPLSVEDFIRGISGLTAAKFVTSGYSNPSINITVTSDNGKRVEKVGITKAGESYIAKRDDGPTLYQLDGKGVTAMQESAAVMKPAAAPQQGKS